MYQSFIGIGNVVGVPGARVRNESESRRAVREVSYPDLDDLRTETRGKEAELVFASSWNPLEVGSNLISGARRFLTVLNNGLSFYVKGLPKEIGSPGERLCFVDHLMEVRKVDDLFTGVLEKALNSVRWLSPDGRDGVKVHLGGNHSISVSALFTALNGYDRGSAFDMGNGLIAFRDEAAGCLPWKFRRAEVGERCWVIHPWNSRTLVSGGIHVTGTVDSGNLVITQNSENFTANTTGGALVSCRDFSLLGILQGVNAQNDQELLFSAVKVDKFYELMAERNAIPRRLSQTSIISSDSGLSDRALAVKEAILCCGNDYTKLRVGNNELLELCNVRGCESTHDGPVYISGQLALRKEVSSGPSDNISHINWRDPRVGEQFVLLYYSADTWKVEFVDKIFTVVDAGSNFSCAEFELDRLTQGKDALAMSVVDCAVIGLQFGTRIGSLYTVRDDPVHPVLGREDLYALCGFLGDYENLQQVLQLSFSDLVDVFRSAGFKSALKHDYGCRLVALFCDKLQYMGYDWAALARRIPMTSRRVRSEREYARVFFEALSFYFDKKGYLVDYMGCVKAALRELPSDPDGGQ